MLEMATPKSTVTARDMTRAMLEDVNEIPTMDGATRIADEYWLRGVYIRPEYLLAGSVEAVSVRVKDHWSFTVWITWTTAPVTTASDMMLRARPMTNSPMLS